VESNGKKIEPENTINTDLSLITEEVMTNSAHTDSLLGSQPVPVGKAKQMPQPAKESCCCCTF